VRFVEEHAKLRAMSQLWEELGRTRYGVTDPRLLRFRYGVQVNSLGLTEPQPENNVQRIVLEALAVTLGRDARARAIQLPAWNEALGLPRPWDQQWSLRIQQVLALETDLLEYPDIFAGSHVMEGLVAELVDGARAEMAVVAEHGGYLRKACSYFCASHVGSGVVQDPSFLDPMQHYENLYAEYFDLYCSTLFPKDGLESASERSLLPLLKHQLNEWRWVILNPREGLPRYRRETEIRRPTGETQRLPQLKFRK